MGTAGGECVGVVVLVGALVAGCGLIPPDVPPQVQDKVLAALRPVAPHVEVEFQGTDCRSSIADIHKPWYWHASAELQGDPKQLSEALIEAGMRAGWQPYTPSEPDGAVLVSVSPDERSRAPESTDLALWALPRPGGLSIEVVSETSCKVDDHGRSPISAEFNGPQWTEVQRRTLEDGVAEGRAAAYSFAAASGVPAPSFEPIGWERFDPPSCRDDRGRTGSAGASPSGSRPAGRCGAISAEPSNGCAPPLGRTGGSRSGRGRSTDRPGGRKSTTARPKPDRARRR
ncbi:hypothetical protein ABT337_29425 [Saccharopolyspora hirsuta]|uniref:hypothetical protein n=1 Tax=Saccharopolyspora hirsuta TaxID=1837 RepID=UPI0014787A6B|nr:hypothetical protein [Saccharopolyspora hirsuta]